MKPLMREVSGGPMKMSFHQYASEIAGAYLVIPLITLGLGVAIHISAGWVDPEKGEV